MLKLNHTERGIAIKALADAEKTWLMRSREIRTTHPTEAAHLESDSINAKMLKTRFEEEQS